MPPAKPTTPEPVKILARAPAYVFGTWRNVLVLGYRAAPTMTDLALREPSIAALRERYPEGIGVVTVVVKEASGALPDAAARRESERQIAAHAAALRCGAVVLEGETVDFTLLRSLLRGIAMVSRRRFPYQFFASIAESAAWMAPHLGHDPQQLAWAIGCVAAAVAGRGR